MQEIKVSVIMPAYNAAQYLEDALCGVLSQTLKEIEVICVDDGSTDNSVEIIEQYAKTDPRIRLIRQEHKDAGAARNSGLKEAKGKYLSFLDSDDLFEPDMLQKAYKTAEEKEADIVVFRSDRLNMKTGDYEEANWTIRSDLLPEKARQGDVFNHGDVSDFFLAFSSAFVWNKLFRAEFVYEKELRFQEQRWFNDCFFVECALVEAKRIVFLDTVLLHKRSELYGSLSTDFEKKGKWRDLFSALGAVREKLGISNSDDILRTAWDRFSEDHLRWNLDQYLNTIHFKDVYGETMEAAESVMFSGGDWINSLKKNEALDYRWMRNLKRKNNEYLFPFEMVPRSTEIILYGAGVVGQSFYRQIKFTDWCNIVAWVDKKPETRGASVVSKEAIKTTKFDRIAIAIRDEKTAEKIKEELRETYGIAEEKIIWRSPEIEL